MARHLRRIHLLGLLVILAMVLAACPASAPAGDTGATGGEGEAAAPAESAGATGIGDRDPMTLNILYWQAVSILNPYLSSGTKDFVAGSLILDPLAEYTPEGVLVPVLAAEIPTLENGGISEDLTTITWKLQEGVVWSDGTPLTADDVVFTWEYCSNPETGCSSANSYEGVANVEAVDELTVLVTFDAPKPFPYPPFTSYLAPVIQQAQFADCVGAAAQGCAEQNTAPIGTGPYKVVDFRANDVVTYERNENYRVEGKPYFDRVVFKGGGDAASAARAALETGEMDYSWNLQVEPQILQDMETAGVGTLVTAFGGNVERILINFTNPSADLGDQRSEWAPDNPNAHPFLTNKTVRQALSMAIDRSIIAEQLYGPAGQPTCNILSGPSTVVSPNTSCEQDIEGANALLDDAGIVDSDGDGIRELDGVPLQILYQTSTNSVRQKTQALVKQWWSEIGVGTELRDVDAAVFFGGDPNSPDTLGKFYTDVEMFTNGPETTDPQNYLAGWLCEDGENIAQSENNYLGNNTERWCSPEYDAMWTELSTTADPDRRIELAIALNDMLHNEYVNLPLVFRGSVSAHSNTLQNFQINGWDSETWNIEDWTRSE
ncbi:MAG: peptide ABC transporter substrate-binding protein [Caldilineaceae bacterium]|nr:peptide ABC transporter substrate-binding protein [Caldilineaceae bacterium]